MRREKIKNKFKLINYFQYFIKLISFIFFHYIKINNLKIYKILTNFNYI